MDNNVIYMKVTDDEYELPVAVADSVAELSRILGVSRSSISSAICHARQRNFKSVYVKVVLEEEA